MSSSKKVFFRENYHYFILGIFTLILIFLHFNIQPSGDDYYHSSAVAGTFREFADFHIHHYLRGNGRALIHFFLTLVFIPGFWFWQVTSPLLTGAAIIAAAKAFGKSQPEQRALTVMMCICYLSFGGKFASYGVYALSPVFNYLYPMILVFLCAFMLRSAYERPERFRILLPLCAFFAGASMEQTGIMTIGYFVLSFAVKYYQSKQKPPKQAVAALAVCVLGYLTVMLAPGNFVRMENATRPFVENFIAAVTMFFNIPSLSAFNFLLIASLSYWLVKIKVRSKLLRVVNLLIPVALAAGYAVNLFILFGGVLTFESNAVISLIWKGYDLLFIAALVYTPALIFIKTGDEFYAVNNIIALGSVFILLFASVSEYRPLIPAAICFSLFISKTAFAALKEKAASRRAAALILSAAVSMCAFVPTFAGFYKNTQVDKINNTRIKEYLAAGDMKAVLYLLPYADEETSSYYINYPGAHYKYNDLSEIYAVGYKRAHSLPDEVEITVEKTP